MAANPIDTYRLHLIALTACPKRFQRSKTIHNDTLGFRVYKYELAAAVTATGAQTAVKPLDQRYRTEVGVFQVTGITTATVALQGRVSSDHDYQTVASLTADGIVSVNLLPDMRVNVAAYTSGTIDATLGVYLRN